MVQTRHQNVNGGANQFVITNNGNCGLTLTLRHPQLSIHFADGPTGNESYRGIVEYDHSVDSMILYTSATERLRITAGQVNIGGNYTQTTYTMQVTGTFNATSDVKINGASAATTGKAIAMAMLFG